MDLATATRLAQTLSNDRFATYLASPEAGGDPVRAMRLYGWNVEVSAAFWGPLQALEVAKRNAMHRELSGAFGRPDWWNEPGLVLTHVAQDQVGGAEDALRRRGRSLAPGAVVAELPFGFWVALLAKGLNYEMQLWRPALRHAFPQYKGARRDLHKPLDYLREFRNRIAHHEPIFSRHLVADLASIRALIGYV